MAFLDPVETIDMKASSPGPHIINDLKASSPGPHIIKDLKATSPGPQTLFEGIVPKYHCTDDYYHVCHLTDKMP